MDMAETLAALQGLHGEDARCVIDVLVADLLAQEEDGELPEDDRVVASVQRADLERFRTMINDASMAQSIATAVVQDRAALHSNRAQEELAVNDNAAAQRLARITPPPGPTTQPRQEPEINDSKLAKLAGRYVSERAYHTLLPEAEAVRMMEHLRVTGDFTSRHTCTSCGDEGTYFETITVDCHHDYCEECVRTLFRLSYTDETLFPPRCCREIIPPEAVDIFLTKELRELYPEKELEFSTPNRTYCSSTTCGEFIKPDNIVLEVALCGHCQTATCAICKATAHEDDCPQDPDIEATLQLAQQQGWRRCDKCKALVELNFGCNHMTCRCGHAFCYICGDQWKNCECDQWNEERLYDRAAQVVDREPPNMDAYPLAEGLVRRVQEVHLWRADAQGEPGQDEREDSEDDNDDVEDPAILREELGQGRVAAREGVEEYHRERAREAREATIREVIEQLRENHECEHPRNSWRYVRGAHPCEICTRRMPQYIFECTECRLRACWACRRNRL